VIRATIEPENILNLVALKMKNSALTIPSLTHFAKLLIWQSLLIFSAQASLHSEATKCGSAIRAALKGNFSNSVSKHSCPVAYDFIMWLRLQENASFSQLQAFLQNHSEWPRQHQLRKKAEQQLAIEGASNSTILTWFKKYPPLTADGVKVYVRALMAANRIEEAQKYLRNSWPTLSLSLSEAQQIAQLFPKILTSQAYFNRASHLLNLEDHTQIAWLIPKLTPLQQKIIQVRLALQKQQPQASQLLSSLPVQARHNPGLTLDQIRWHRKQEQNNEMLVLLRSVQVPENMRELFWRERNILVRRFIEERRYHDAYEVARGHGLERGENFANAEWLAGWLALQFVNQRPQAIQHFQNLAHKVMTPISVARAHYWLGRAYEAIHKKEQATTHFQKAQAHPATYYGQLASKQLSGAYPKVTLKRPIISSQKRQEFERNALVQVVHLLHLVREKKLAEPFLLNLAQSVDEVEEQILLIELAHEKLGNYCAVDVCKKSTKSTAPLIPAAYPKIAHRYSDNLAKIDVAFVHAIIRQESRFKHDAVSSAGATGLMQLMPATAQKTAQKLKLKYKKIPLCDPKTNIQLGSAHLKELLDRFQGSFILAAAAYNAGAQAVDRWLVQYGDPRQRGVDPVDWIELIPYAETRNYVQRVIENYHCYR
jgi:soluble lytic murein transglycosylase